MTKKRTPKGEGKIQIVACLDKIKDLAERGYGPVAIHRLLVKEGLLTLSYSGFYEAAGYSKIRKERRAEQKTIDIHRAIKHEPLDLLKPNPQKSQLLAAQKKSVSPAAALPNPYGRKGVLAENVKAKIQASDEFINQNQDPAVDQSEYEKAKNDLI